MSLLMDALRKAEESKKQAEQEKIATSPAEAIAPVAELTSSEQATDTGSAGQTYAVNIDKPEPTINEQPPSNIDVQAEFNGPGTTTEPAESLESNVDLSTNPVSSLELEPQHQTIARTQSYTTDQLQISIPARDDDKVEPEKTPDGHRGEDAESISSFLSSTKLDQAVSKASSELEKQKPRAVAVPVETKTEPAKKAAVDIPQVTKKPVAESIVERTAGSRRSAKKVFAAKKLGQKGSRTFLISVAGIAVVMVLGIGFYITTSLTASSGISIPADDFPISQAFSNDNSISDTVADDEGAVSFSSADETNPASASTNSIQTDASFGFDAVAVVANTEVTVISDQSVSLETLNPVRIEDPSVVERALGQTSPDIFSTNSISLSNVVIDEPIGEVFVAEDSVSDSSLSAASNSLSSTADSSISSNGDSQVDSGLTLGAASNVASAAVPVARELVNFRRTNQQQTIAPALVEGFRAYQKGDLDLARDLYEQTLTDSPENIDALLGLATIASSQQELSLAMGLYSRALSLDPSNTLAKTAISALTPLGTPAEQERELRRLDAQNPNVAPLAFVLGNFYASQLRWSDAQRYYFKALQLAKSNSQSGSAISPDYAFNLAVSLERLNQAGPALNFYEEALALATRFPSNFDLSIARARLESLSRTNSP